MRPLLSIFAALFASLSVAYTSETLTITNLPVADTYFETYGSEDKNFGTATILRMDQWEGRQIFLRFPVANVPGDQRLLRAVLRLHIADMGFNEQGEFPELKTCIAVYDVATPWTETGLTFKSPDGTNSWSQGPGIPGGQYWDVGPLRRPDIGVRLALPAVALDPIRLRENSDLDLDITDFMREALRVGKTEVDLLLKTSTLGRNFSFNSREHSEPGLRPRLIMEVDRNLGDFRLRAPFLSSWKTGDSVKVEVQGQVGGGALETDSRWVLSGKPQASRLESKSLKPGDSSATFCPDVPGKYQVRLEVKGSVPDEAWTSDTVELYALALRPHPRLYVTSESLKQIRTGVRTGSRLSRAFLEWVTAGSRAASQGRFHDMGLHEGCENTALAWLMTEDRQWLSNSITYAQMILQKPMREHFEDVHAATFLGAAWVHAMALHYDWCYDQLPSDHRQAVVEWLTEAASWAWVRSGKPVAHNDGGARQCLLASAALALLGDDAGAEQLYRRSHENFTQTLLPWLNDGGRGGRSGDGGEYEGLHAFYIVRYAWLAHSATGEDVFSESPFFFNRLNHILHGWYPRPLVERSGAFSMRQYYSPSGDHIRMGYVGDTQPYQSAAALCARYRDTPEAQGVRWLAGEWPVRWMQYTLRWAVLGGFESIPAREPSALAYLDPGCNTVYARSDWSNDATWILFENAPFVSAHGSLDSGTFEIFKGDLLAARTGNLDHANVGAKHTMNYLHRTIAGNCLLIEDPEEKWKGFLGGAEGAPDGGGQRTNFPLGSSPDAETYVTYRDLFQRGRIAAFSQGDQWVYAAADLTPAYNNPSIHGGKLNRPKVDHVSRELLYLRGLDSVVVFDRVSSIDAGFKKTWLLHSLGDLDVVDGIETRVDEGESRFTGATRAVIRHGWSKPVPSFGRCLSVTLLPKDARITRIGGRVELPEGQTEGFPGDQWHGKHTHRHVKDFWVKGTNYPPGNPPEIRWFGAPGTRDYVPGTPDETGGRGKWRIEVSPASPAEDDVFFHVLCPRLGKDGPFPKVQFHPVAAPYSGALISEAGRNAAVFFCQQPTPQKRFSCTLPADAKFQCYVTGLSPGRYQVRIGDGPVAPMPVSGEGLLVLESAAGSILITEAR